MLERLKNLPSGIDGVEAIGKVTKEDYEQVIAPLIDEARREGRHIRFLYYVGPRFDGFTPGAAWEDAKVGIHNLRLFGACAVVTDTGWIRESTRLAGFMMPCPVRVFANHELDQATAWLASLPESAAIQYRVLPDVGVIVVEVKQPLRLQDFDSLAFAADAWIEEHGSLQGVVIHAREFPGWENFESLVRHIRFVRDHHRKVRRVALAADAKFASLAPKIGEHFVQAALKSFKYDELDAAIAWAAGRATGAVSSASSQSASE